jgi:hypothetical protein
MRFNMGRIYNQIKKCLKKLSVTYDLIFFTLSLNINNLKNSLYLKSEMFSLLVKKINHYINALAL